MRTEQVFIFHIECNVRNTMDIHSYNINARYKVNTHQNDITPSHSSYCRHANATKTSNDEYGTWYWV